MSGQPPQPPLGGGPPAPPAKTLVGGRYELDELLGRGGMAEVRKGCDLRLGRTVAVKRLRPDLASDPTFQARFRREAQSAASLNHPTIVSVYDTGEEVDASGLAIPYIVMEFVEGRTLRDILREGRKILPERSLEITAGVLTALESSHRAGIVHRDIKPANVMLNPTGDVKVMDFGIARAIADSSATVTQTAAVVGTAQYLSPEQARGEQVDSRSDIYSTGCLLYELLTGRPPFVGDSPVSVAYQHVREDPAPPSTLDPEIPPAIDAITLKALAKDPDRRYQSAVQMREDIERALAGERVDAPPVPVDAGTTLLPATPVTQPLGSTAAGVHGVDDEPPRNRRAWAYVLLGFAVVALLVLAAVVGRALFADAGATTVSVPQVIGLTEAEARARLTQEGLEVGDVDQGRSNSVPRGRVMAQDPQRATFVDVGTPVDLVVSGGRRLVAVPPVDHLRRDQAEQVLEDANLVARFVVEPSAETKNQVTRTDPPAGERVAAGSTVTVYYSQGLPTVPDVRDMTQEAAEELLRARGFEPVVSLDFDSSEDPGIVVDQEPSGGAKRPAGTPVVIEVAAAQPTTPTVTVTSTPTDPPTPTESEPTTPTTPPGSPPQSPGTPPTTGGNGNGNGGGNGGGPPPGQP